MLDKSWNSEGLPSVWDNFIAGMTTGHGRDRDSVISFASDLVSLAGGDNVTLAAIVEDMLVYVGQQVNKNARLGGDAVASDAINEYEQTQTPRLQADDPRSLEEVRAEWRQHLTENFRSRYNKNVASFQPRVSRSDLAATYGFFRAMAEDPRSLPPLHRSNHWGFKEAAAKYAGIQI